MTDEAAAMVRMIREHPEEAAAFEEKEDKRFSSLSVWQPSAKWIMLAGLSKDPEEESSLFTSVLRLRKHYEPKKEDEQ